MIIEILLACFALLGVTLISATVIAVLARVNDESDRSHNELMREFERRENV